MIKKAFPEIERIRNRKPFSSYSSSNIYLKETRRSYQEEENLFLGPTFYYKNTVVVGPRVRISFLSSAVSYG
jgi:hypothetical protein